MTLHTVFAINRYKNRDLSYRFGTTEIRLGDDHEGYNLNNSKVYGPIYDGGFFPIGTTYNGRYLTFRRIYVMNRSNYYELNEVRAYQVPNLIQELANVTISADTSPSTSADVSATNLITNLNNRAPTNVYNAINAADQGLASYKSCY